MKTVSVGWHVEVVYEYERYFFNLFTKIKSHKYIYTVFTYDLNTGERRIEETTSNRFYAMHLVDLLRNRYKHE